MIPARGKLHIDTARLLRRGGEAFILALTAAAFVAGALAGAAAGSSDAAGSLSFMPEDGSIYGHDSFAAALFSCGGFHLLVLLFSTSLLGVFLIPATMAVRGFSLACSTAWLAITGGESGRAMALVSLGLPNLFAIPALFITAQWSMGFSARLLACYGRRPLPMTAKRDAGRLAIVCGMLLAAAAVEYFVVPPLAQLMLNQQ